MSGAWSAGATRAAEALLRVAGRAVVVRRRPAGGNEMPPQEVTLRPCVLRVSGAIAELLVSALAVAEAGAATELFAVGSRIVADDVVWRIAAHSPVMCGAAAICWRVRLAR